MATRLWRSGLDLAPGALAASLVLVMLWLTRRGLEILDESYLLRLIADPQATRAAGDVYLFGFVVHPLWELVGHDIALLRAAGITANAAAAAWLCCEGVALLRTRGVAVPRRRVLVGCLLSAASSVTVLSFNVMVPAYRSLTLTGLVITAAGTARALRGQPVLAGVLVGVGLVTCFVGKPTSAVALVVMVVGFGVGTRRLSLRCLGGALGGGLTALALTLATARMAPWDAVTYLQRGAHTVSLLGDHPNLRVLLGLTDVRLQGLYLFGPWLLLPALAATAFRHRRSVVARLGVDTAGMVALVLAGVLTAALATSVTASARTGWQVLALGWFVPLVTVLELLRRRRSSAPLPEGLHGWSFFLLVLPYAGAVGSNLPFSTVVPLMMTPWVVAALVVLLAPSPSSVAGRRPAFAVAATAVVTVLGVMVWVVHANSPTAGDLGGRLLWAPVADGALQLQAQDASAARALREVAAREHISSATPVVDLTGFGAGYAFMTGGRPLGRAHMYSYSAGAARAAAYGLAQESCTDRSHAWLLVYGDASSSLERAVFVGGLSRGDYSVELRFPATRDGATHQFELLRPGLTVSDKMGCGG